VVTAVGDQDRMRRIFSPRSVVVVGASADPAKRGNHVIRALRESGYRHPIHGVNPRGGQAYGVGFIPSVHDLPQGVDLALVALPGRLVPETVRDLGRRDVAGAVVLANGFGESGTDGARLQSELDVAVRESGVRVIGPNTSGLLNVPLGLNLVGLPDVPAGPITVLTQSGNMLLSLVEDARTAGSPGFASYVGLGNLSDLAYHECLDHFATDEATGVIAVHSEGLSDGRAFLASAARASRTRPVVMLRGGRTEAGRQTAASHTGAIAGPDKVAVAVLRQAGVELVDRSDELAIVSGVLATTAPPAAGTGVAVLADGGGHATLAADALAARGVPLAELSETTRERLSHLLGAVAAVHNPVDVAGATDADPTIFADAVDVLMRDPAVGLVLVIGLYGGYHVRFDPRLADAEDRTARRLVDLGSEHSRPLLVQSCYAPRSLPNHTTLRKAGVPVLSSIDQAVRAVAALTHRAQRLATLADRSDLALADPRPRPANPVATRSLSEPDARRVAEEGDLKLGSWAVATSPDELERCLEQLAVPCAVKVVSPQVVHKSDAGGVELWVGTGQGKAVWSKIVAAVAGHTPGAVIDGMVVTPMADRGVELLVGATRDPIFGPVVAFGSGGVLVEALDDVSFRAAPMTRLEATELIAETTISRILDGHRRLPAVDRDALAELLVRVGDLMVARPEIVELDLNPVIAAAGHLQPVDVRIVVADHTQSTVRSAR
jgi:acetyltransferase